MKKNTAKEFWERVDISGDGWHWLGTKNGRYGSFGYDSKNISAHKFSYEMENGKVPQGFEIDHLCRNRYCVNPAHLEAVTHKVNMERSKNHTDRKHKLPLGVYRNNGRTYMVGKYLSGRYWWISGFRNPDDAKVAYETMVLDDRELNAGLR